MSVPVEKHRYSIAEYLALEEKANDRHEFHEGEILAMSGGTYEHSRINTNMLVGLGSRLKGKPCQPLDSNMRVRTGFLARYVYPDISVVCGAPEFDRDDLKKTTILNPRLIIEVLSDSTESYDRGTKFELYREIVSLQEYVMVSQREALVETYLRQKDGAWLFRAFKGMETVVELRSMEIVVPLAEIYEGIQLGGVTAQMPAK